MAEFLFKNVLLVTMNPAREVFHGDLLVRDDRIACLFKAGKPDSMVPPTAPGTRVIDGTGCALLPGFVQSHIHLCQTLFRNHAEDLRLLDWLQQKIWPFEAAHTAGSMRLSARLGIAELLAGGTTTILDMGSVHHYDEVFAEAERWGLRLVGGKCMMDLGDQTPAGLRETTAASLQESERLREHWHGAAAGRLRYAYAPRFALSCSEALLRAVAEAAGANGCLVHTPAAATVEAEPLL
ncbi:MAG: amidohydrolase family protein, partial [candidate division KSB1 bacterium]|nr:amidohydrolase family protein [candidate division KSB1 bacterium]